LQYGEGPNPYGFISLDSSVMSQQSYDVVVDLDLPRSPPNLEAGNFMLDMAFLSPSFQPPVQIPDLPFNARDTISADTVLFTIPPEAVLFSSRRPAILTYHPKLVSYGKEIAGMPWYLLGWGRDSEKLEIKMAEGISFKKGYKNVPNTVYLELRSPEHNLQAYHVMLKLRARFSGVRWLMYNHRIFSFVFFTAAFWTAEVLFAILAWALWNQTPKLVPGKLKGEAKGDETDGSAAIKAEKEDGALETDDLDLSDTPRSFPTYGRQAPLRYIPKVKMEDDSEEYIMDEAAIQPLAAEADDESEEPVDVGASFRGGRSDSGIGTSFSEGGASTISAAQRRRLRAGKGPA